jgi:hypothetical protein
MCPSGLVNIWDLYANGSSACKPCWPPTTYAASKGDACYEARVGYVVNSAGTGDVICPAGTYRGRNDTLATACLQCAAGYIAATSASAQCMACPVGTFAATGGMTACAQCGVTVVADRPGSSGCRVCEQGHRAVGSMFCEACPNNTYSSDGVACHECVDELPYAPIGASACMPCPDWTTMSSRGKCEVCDPGTYMRQIVGGGGGPNLVGRIHHHDRRQTGHGAQSLGECWKFRGDLVN